MYKLTIILFIIFLTLFNTACTLENEVKESSSIETNSSSIVAYCEASVDVSASEILEYINIAFDGDTRYAKISEIGFFTGIDAQVTKDGTTYMESLYTQLYNHVTWLGANLTREGMTFESTFQINSNGSIAEQ